jgi:hypothetical protein
VEPCDSLDKFRRREIEQALVAELQTAKERARLTKSGLRPQRPWSAHCNATPILPPETLFLKNSYGEGGQECIQMPTGSSQPCSLQFFTKTSRARWQAARSVEVIRQRIRKVSFRDHGVGDHLHVVGIRNKRQKIDEAILMKKTDSNALTQYTRSIFVGATWEAWLLAIENFHCACGR